MGLRGAGRKDDVRARVAARTVESGKRQAVRGPGAEYSGRGAKSGDNGVMERHDPFRAVIPCRRERHLRRDHARRDKAGIDALQPVEALDEEAGGRDQHDGERDLGDDERCAQPLGATARGTPPSRLLEGSRRIVPGRGPGGHGSEDHSRGGGAGQGEAEDRGVQPDAESTGQRRKPHALEGVDAPYRNEKAEKSARQEEHEALGQEHAHHAQAAGAERRADRKLLLPPHGPRKEQPGDIRASDQERGGHARLDEPEHAADILHVLLKEARDAAVKPARLPEVAAPGKALGISSLDQVELELDALHRGAGLQPHDHLGVLGPALIVAALGGRESERHPGLGPGAGKIKILRHHADDGDGPVVEPDGPADDGRVGGEPVFPQGVAEDDRGRGVRLCVVLVEDAPEGGGRLEGRKERRGGPHACDHLRLRVAGQVEAHPRVQGAVGYAGDPAAVEIVGDRVAGIGKPHLGIRVVDIGQPVGAGPRIGFQEDGVDDAENGAVCAYAERQRQDRDHGKPGGLGELAEGEADVVHVQFSFIRSCASHWDMSERMTRSPGSRPFTISIVLTELRPSCTCARFA